MFVGWGMFWKAVNLKRIQTWSLVSKLMTLYSLSTLGILTAVYLYLYPTFIKLINQISGNHTTSNECFEKIIITLLLSTLGAIFLGNIVARNGLSKIQQFSARMQKISVSSLHERIELKDWPKELAILGKEFNSMLDRLEESFTKLSRFSSDIAHEIRTPLNNLKGITELALTKEKTAEEYRQVLVTNISEYEYLTKLIENLFFLARTDNGLITINKTQVNAQKEIINILEYFQAVADEKQIGINCEGDALLLVDPILFKRAVNNLLSNALRYTDPQGRINIKIKALNKSLVQISFHDTGLGIANQHLTKLCDRFYRIDPSRSSHSGSLGLGLAIVKSIMNLHKGTITIESQLGVGTCAHLFFPI